MPTTVRPRHYQKLSERLRQFMAENHFQDGDKLPPERALAESFGVSRNSVREAIHALAERGLLESRHGDGTYVRVPDMEPLRSAILEAVDSEGHLFDEVMEYRRILEPAVAELAALRRTPEQLDRLKIIACDQQRRIPSRDDGELDANSTSAQRVFSNRLLIGAVALLNESAASSRLRTRGASWHQFSVTSPHHDAPGDSPLGLPPSSKNISTIVRHLSSRRD
ncbi:MAG: FadR/GntR family transcriptional regulator [Bilophila wadsworthia]